MSFESKLDEALSSITRMLGGGRLGQGSMRRVYDLGNGTVLKVAQDLEDCEGIRANKDEWEIWDNAEGTSSQKFLAPIEHCSYDGKYLIQQKTTPVHDLEDIPDKVPDWMVDLKPSNWGVLDGKVVCHDYGNHDCIRKSLGKAKLVKAEKWKP